MSKIRLVISAVAALGVLSVSACSSDEEPPKETIKQTSTKEDRKDSQKKSRSKKFSAKELKAAVTKADLGSADVGRDVSRGSHSEGMDGPTNDICGEQGKSDSSRIGRIQDHFWNPESENPRLVVSNEVVAYKPGKGAGVLKELEQAVAGCDGWEHDSGKIENLRLVEPPSGAVGASFAWRATDIKEGQTYHYMAVYQTNGDLMSAVYVWAKSKGALTEVANDLVPTAADKLQGALK